MSDDKVIVELKERETLGKGLAKLRDEGSVPAVIHVHGKPSIHVVGDYIQLTKVYSKAGKRQPVHLKLDGKQRLAIIKDADFEPTKHLLRHVVFQSIKQNEKVTTEIPIVLVGDEIPAELAGHMVLPQLDTIQVEALPNDLPDKVEVDATKLVEVGDRLTVADLTVPANVTILTEPEHSIAVVEMPKDQVAEANAAAESLAEEAAGRAEEGEEEKAGQEEEKSSEEQTAQDEPKSEEK